MTEELDLIRTFQTEHSVEISQEYPPVEFVARGRGDLYGLQVRIPARVVSAISSEPDPVKILLALFEQGIAVASANLDTCWHDPTYGQIDRSIQQHVEGMQVADGERYPRATVVAMESTLQHRRDH